VARRPAVSVSIYGSHLLERGNFGHVDDTADSHAITAHFYTSEVIYGEVAEWVRSSPTGERKKERQRDDYFHARAIPH
jgi:hypothetical protein